MAEEAYLLALTDAERTTLKSLLAALGGGDFVGSGGIEVRREGGRTSIVLRRRPPREAPVGSDEQATVDLIQQWIITGKVTGDAGKTGVYTGRSFTDRTTDFSAGAGDLAEGDLGTLAAADDCLLLNLPELGLSPTAHYVTAAANTGKFSRYFVGRVAYINSDGTKVVHGMIFFAGC